MSHATPAYLAELYADKSEMPEVLDSLSFNADSPAAAKRRFLNWAAEKAGVADSAWASLHHCSTPILEKQVAELLRHERDKAPGGRPLEQQGRQTAGSEAHGPKLLEPIFASLEFARTAFNHR